MDVIDIRLPPNVGTVITFPMIHTPTLACFASLSNVKGSTPVTMTSVTWSDTTAPKAFANLSTNTGRAAEIGGQGASGRYYFTLTAAEMNFPYIYVVATCSSKFALPTDILITTVAVPSVTAVTNAVGINWAAISNPTASVGLTGTTVNTTTHSVNNYTVSTVTQPVSTDWNRIVNPTATVSFTGTTINSVTNSVNNYIVQSVTRAIGVDLALTQNATATLNLTATTLNSVTNVTVVHSLSKPIVVTTNNDKTGYAIGTGGIASTAFAAGAIDNAALAQSAGQEVADEVLNRDLATGASATDRNVKNALRALRNKVSESGGTLTVTEEDDATPAWTAAVTRTASTDPITSVDPA